MGSGTTGNEALHAELKQAFRQTIRLHQSTMATKMRVFLFQKLLSFTLARFRPTTRQMRPTHVLARALAHDTFEEAAWALVCERKDAGKALRKAAPSLMLWRRVDVGRVRRWLRKGPRASKGCSGEGTTGSKARGRAMKRTAFTLKRRASA